MCSGAVPTITIAYNFEDVPMALHIRSLAFCDPFVLVTRNTIFLHQRHPQRAREIAVTKMAILFRQL